MPFQWGNCLDDESVTIRAENRKHSWLIPSVWCEMDLDIKAPSVDSDKSGWHEFLVSKPLPLYQNILYTFLGFSYFRLFFKKYKLLQKKFDIFFSDKIYLSSIHFFVCTYTYLCY